MSGTTGIDVLVVEDDPDMADVVLRVLQMAGYTANRVENGEQALAAVERLKPSVVLLDVLMPVMDGWECARALRIRYGCSLPIVLATAAEHAGGRAAELGANDVLPKPFGLQDLLEVVGRYANGRGAVGM